MECFGSRYFFECRFFYWNNYFVCKFSVLILWIPLKQKPGIGTILNALIIAIMIDICINFVPTPENYISQILLAVVAVLTVGLGGGIYLVANLGPGPRDGLMIGLQKYQIYQLLL